MSYIFVHWHDYYMTKTRPIVFTECHNPYGRRLLVDPKNGQKRLLKRYLRVWVKCNIFSTCLSKVNTDWSMRKILELQMPRYSKIMLIKIVVIFSPPSSLQLWVATNERSDRRNDPTISFWLLNFFSKLSLHAWLASPSVADGRLNFRLCPRSHQHWTLSKFRPSGHRSHPRPNQSK